MASIEVAATSELAAINDLITRLCGAFPAVARPAVFHIVRVEYEKHPTPPAGISMCAFIEGACVERLARLRPGQVA